MNLSVHILSLILIFIVIFNYRKVRNIPIESNKIFFIFLCISAVHLCFDIATVLTIFNMDSVSPWLNKVCHQFFIASLDILIFTLYIYVDERTKAKKSKVMDLLKVVPLAVSLIIVTFGELKYFVSPDGRYAYGIVADTVYLSVSIYIILTVLTLIINKDGFKKEAKIYIVIGILIWLICAMFQYFNPTMLISSGGIAVMVLFIYLAFENPTEYMDMDINTLNSWAFKTAVEEKIRNGKSFYIVNFVFNDVEQIQRVFGYSAVIKIMRNAAQKFDTFSNSEVYRLRSNILSFVIYSFEQLEKVVSEINEYKFSYCGEQDGCFEFKYTYYILECPKYAENIEEILSWSDYMKSGFYAKNFNSTIVWIDEKIIRKKEYFESVEKLVGKALANDGFEMHYQPIFSVRENKFTSAEALVRLKDEKTLGFVSPEIFIPIMEERGLIRNFGTIVFEKVCKFIKEKELWKFGVKYIEVNISRIQGMDLTLPENFYNIMKNYGIEPNFINLEITETASSGSGEILIRNMGKLKEKGCHFSMDDFGTGYSNLSQICELNFDLIKLDKSLIWPCFQEGGENAMVVLNCGIEMISKLGLDIVAEGIETKEQADILSEKGVNYLQGYYYSKPISESEYIEFLKKQL